MDNRREVRDFLVSRRAKITPDRAGLAAYGSNRRVPGLRREEVALLAGVSVDYYTRLEKGKPPRRLRRRARGCGASHDALRLLASWAAPDAEPETQRDPAEH